MKYSIFLTLFICILVFIFLPGCGPGNAEQADVEKMEYQRQVNHVDTVILKLEAFKHEIVSNGKLRARRKSELKFNVAGRLRSLKLKNGDVATQGQVIAVLDQFQYQQDLEQAQLNQKKSYIDLQTTLIGQGYDLIADSARIPAHIYEYSAIRSGYLSAVKELKTAGYNFAQTVLKAPFRGKLADIKYHIHEQVGLGDVFCNLIDDSVFEVEFYLIEAEVGEINLRDKVVVHPFSVQTLRDVLRRSILL